MWTIQHGLLIVVLVAVIWPLLAWLPQWVGNARWLPYLTHEGRRFGQREHMYKGHRQALLLSTALRQRRTFDLRRLGALDRWLVASGLARHGGVGRPAFDERWFLECQGDATARLFDSAVIEAVEGLALGLETRGYRLRSLGMKDFDLICRIDRNGGDARLPVMQFLPLLAPVAEALQRALEQDARPPERDTARAGGGGVFAVLATLVALAWIGLLRSHRGPDLLEPGRVFVDSLWLGLPLALAVLGGCWLIYRDDRRGARLLGRMLLIGLPAAMLSGHTLLREGNILLDRAEPQTVSLPQAQVLWTRAGRRGYTTWTTLPPVPGRTTEAVDLSIRYASRVTLGLGWPPSNRRVALEVDVMPGRFGYAWVRSIRSAD